MFLAPDWGSFHSFQHALLQTVDILEFVPGDEDIKRKLQEEFMRTGSRNPELEEGSPCKGQRKNGKPDLRLRENRRSLGPQNKDGSPEMRFKINKEKLGNKVPVAASQTSNHAPRSSYTAGPVKRDGTPDMRYAVNKLLPPLILIAGMEEAYYHSNHPIVLIQKGPVKKDGTPNMGYAVNNQSASPSLYSTYGGSSLSQLSLYSTHGSGPVKKDGAPDMKYAVKKQSASPSPHSNYGGSSLSQLSLPYSDHASGPVKKDGTPDMRYAVNRLSQVTLLGGQATVLDNLQEEVSLDQVPLDD